MCVMVEDLILSFSPTFSFDNFVTHAFPDIVMDIDSFA